MGVIILAAIITVGIVVGLEVFTTTITTTFAIMQSLRLDRGPSGPVHP